MVIAIITWRVKEEGGNKLGNHKAQVLREMDNFP